MFFLIDTAAVPEDFIFSCCYKLLILRTHTDTSKNCMTLPAWDCETVRYATFTAMYIQM